MSQESEKYNSSGLVNISLFIIVATFTVFLMKSCASEADIQAQKAHQYQAQIKGGV